MGLQLEEAVSLVTLKDADFSSAILLQQLAEPIALSAKELPGEGVAVPKEKCPQTRLQTLQELALKTHFATLQLPTCPLPLVLVEVAFEPVAILLYHHTVALLPSLSKDANVQLSQQRQLNTLSFLHHAIVLSLPHLPQIPLRILDI